MSINRAGAIALATAALFVASCQTDEQETQKFGRADHVDVPGATCRP